MQRERKPKIRLGYEYSLLFIQIEMLELFSKLDDKIPGILYNYNCKFT